MKRFLSYIVLFFICFVFCDIMTGLLMSRLRDNAKGGVYKQMSNLINENEYDIIVFGSSRASHHYVPSIIADSLGMSCYNAGQDGMGVVYATGLLSLILDNYSPRFIILDCSKGVDILKNPRDDNNLRYLSLLKPYSEFPVTKDVFRSVAYFEYYKTASAFYRYNSLVFDLIRENISPSVVSSDGFNPLSGYITDGTKRPNLLSCEIDTIKTAFLVRFINIAKAHNIPIIVVVSPMYNCACDPQFQPAVDICRRLNVPFYDCVDVPSITYRKDLFKDCSHLNYKGAQLFSSFIASKIKSDSLIMIN